MNSEFDTAEFHLLISELRDSSITPERHQRLESILRQHPHARHQWFLFCDIETGLKDWAVTEDERRSNHLPTNKTKAQSRPLQKIVASVAATILIAVTLGVWLNRPSNPATNNEVSQTEVLVGDVAVLTHAVGAEWQVNAESLSAGSTLAPSMLRLRSGALLIEFFSGATVVLEGPAEFEILSKTKGHLLTGKLNAHVPPQAQGFTIKTSAGDIVDHGTDFGVNMATEVPDELHVFRGKVEVKSGGKSRDVETGEAIRLGSENLEVFDADRSAFLVEDELIQQSRLASERRLDQWRNASGALSSDPATLYHLRLDGSHETTGTTRVLVNSAMGSDPSSGGSLVGSQRVAGRWHGKSGVSFGGPGDRIRLTISQPMKVVTLLAWANVQSLSRWQNSLLSADSETPGSIHWQLTKRGQLRLAIARDLGGAQSDWEAVESQPFLTEGHYRQWMLLATTFDGTTIRHYANGRQVGTGASFTPDALHIGTAEIGNWLGDTRRELHAILDEFVVLNRVLREEEIVEIHRYGKP